MANAEFLRARDFLLEHRLDYQSAYEQFRWPQLTEFNWALDYFDPMAIGNSRPALRVLDESGRETVRTFAELSARSNQVANYLRRIGVRRYDRILVMLGNEVPLWEVTLAACKIGAVIAPATTLLSVSDLRGRLESGRIRHIIATESQTAKFSEFGESYTRITNGSGLAGWHALSQAENEPESYAPECITSASDPLLLYFTSGTTAEPKMVEHSHASYPVGHLTTMYWLGLQQDDVHWNISSPGWAKHAWSSVFAPWNAGATVFAFNYARFDANEILNVLARHEISSICAPPTVWRMLIQQNLQSHSVRLRSAVSAGEPLNAEVIGRVRDAWGIDIRDGYGQTETTCLIANSRGQRVEPGAMGRPMPGYRVELLDADGKPSIEGEVSLDLSQTPVGLMLGYAGDRREQLR